MTFLLNTWLANEINKILNDHMLFVLLIWNRGMSVGMIIGVAIGSTALIVSLIFIYQWQSKMQIARRSRIGKMCIYSLMLDLTDLEL